MHFRVGKTDGVSLEIAAWKKILTEAGAMVKLCSGPVSVGADYVITNLEPQLDPVIFDIDESAFGEGSIRTEDKLMEAIEQQKEKIKSEFRKILDEFRPDNLIVSNIFSVGINLPVAGAITEVLDERKIKTVAVHHDFWWEKIRYKEPVFSFVRQQLEEFFPPIRSWLTHCCINTIAQKNFKKRMGVSATVLYDTINFDSSPVDKTKSNDLFNYCEIDEDDIVVLQATRIVRRKNIEIVIDLVKNLSLKYSKNFDGGLYNGKKFNSGKNKIVLVLAGYPEKRDLGYRNTIFAYAKASGVTMVYLGDVINESEGKYDLLDAYPMADIVSYPSEYEGFGNQFLEAICMKKPIVVFEYPVFKTDIAPKGFSYISLGDKLILNGDLKQIPAKVLDSASEQIVDLLTSKKRYQELVEENWKIGRRYFSYEATFPVLLKLLG